MNALERVENSLACALGEVTSAAQTPPRLGAAMHHAVFPGGARVRPMLVVNVASALGEDDPETTDRIASAIELLHCASLVHDDLPCFDDASMRRGIPSVHAAFGEPLAVLTGDALISLAFEQVAGSPNCRRAIASSSILARAIGAAGGIIGGQAWESEPNPDLRAYHRAKTGALFVAATTAGAVAAGADPAPWRAVGSRLGEAYQIADDLRDALGGPCELGKPVCQDVIHGRPSAAIELGVDASLERIDALVSDLVESVPVCPGRSRICQWLEHACSRLYPRPAVRLEMTATA